MNKTYSEEVAAYRKAKRLTTILRLTSCLLVLCCLTLQFPYEFWSAICLIPFFTAYILFLYKPTYFSLCGTGNSSKPIISVSEIIFFSSFCSALIAFFINHLSYVRLVFVSAIVAAVIAGIAIFRCHTIHRISIKFLLLILSSSMLTAFSLVSDINYSTGTQQVSQVHIGTITNVDIYHAKSGASYSIDVADHGKEFNFSIDESEYEQFSVGDRIPIYFYFGGLGIPFVDIVKYEG